MGKPSMRAIAAPPATNSVGVMVISSPMFMTTASQYIFDERMANDHTYEVFAPEHGVPIKAWTRGVPVEDEAKQQLLNIASLPFIYRWIAVMPDVHLGKGATVGSVIPSHKAIIPAAVGVDLGCGVMAVQTSLLASDLPDNLFEI